MFLANRMRWEAGTRQVFILQWAHLTEYLFINKNEITSLFLEISDVEFSTMIFILVRSMIPNKKRTCKHGLLRVEL